MLHPITYGSCIYWTPNELPPGLGAMQICFEYYVPTNKFFPLSYSYSSSTLSYVKVRIKANTYVLPSIIILI